MAVSRYYSSVARRTTLTADLSSSATSMSVAAATGFPSLYPYTLIIDQDTVNEEIVTVTNRSGTTLTVTRGADGTAAVAHTAGAQVEHGVSARDFTESRQHEDASEAVHGLGAGSSVVGTTDTQTLTNKTLTSPTINTPTVTGGTITGATITDPTFTGDLKAPAAYGVEFEGTTADAYETRLIAAGPTADRTVTLPDATDTLVGRATADTLTNKTVSGATLSGTTTNTGTISGGTVSGATISSGSLGTDLDANSQKITGVATPVSGTDAANKSYVDTAVSNVVDAAPGALDTLNELAAALGDDANFSTTVTNSIATKLAKSGDTMTGDLTMSSGATVTGVPTPSASSDAVPLSYVTTLYGSTASAATSAAASAASASAASSSATSASGSATAASNSATAAANSATAAAGSATAAAGSATAAASSAATAEATIAAAEDVLDTANSTFGDGRVPLFLMMGA